MGRPLWSPPPGNPDKPAPPARCESATLPPPNPARSTPSTWAPDYSPSPSPSPSSSSSSSSSSSGIAPRHSRLTDDDQQRRSLPRGDGMVMRSDSSMLTLDEFLRETSAASATRDEAERHLTNLLSLRRRMGAEHPDTDRRRDWASISPPEQHDLEPVPGPTTSWRALVEHTPAGRARILGALPAAGTASSVYEAGRPGLQAPGLRPASYTYTPLPPNSQDGFDTLVGQIRRIGALQDFMLSSVGEATLEDSTAGGTASTAATAAPDAMPGEENTAAEAAAAGGNGEEGERNAVAALRVREARLRAMQTRIDLLASEFALLRNTRRELRRVEAEALSTLQTASARNTAAVSALTSIPAPSRSSLALRTQAADNLAILQARNVAPTSPRGAAATRAQTAVDRYITNRRTLPDRTRPPPPPSAGVRAEWGRQGSGNRDGDGEEGGAPRWTIGERDRVLRREVMRMQIESLPAGGV